MMDLRLSPAHEAFRREVRTWLSASSFPARPPVDAAGIEEHGRWERQLHAAGFAGLTWPRAYGGQERDPLVEAVFKDEYARARGPERITTIGVDIVGPALGRVAAPEQCRRWLPPMLDASELWALGFSEPEAGSDLAALRTTARPSAGGHVLRGEKVWTSMAQWARWLLCLARTEPAQHGSRGLSVFVIPLPHEAVEIFPLRQVHGRYDFCLVRLNDVEVTADALVGREGGGWDVAMAVFEQERGAISPPGRLEADLEDARTLARARDLGQSPLVRMQVAQLGVRVRAYRHHVDRELTRIRDGDRPGSRASVTKLMWSGIQADILGLMRALGGEWSEVQGGHQTITGEAHRAEWHHQYWQARAGLIYGGATEIQRDIVAKRILHLM
jgi:alkylation response protein AidB-like acyl-CoA dehydrogenase